MYGVWSVFDELPNRSNQSKVRSRLCCGSYYRITSWNRAYL
ncbi:MAG: hypothetical protein FWG84_06540 [Bacteroidales bacterium]|nr:hypothetical protein [Bacteroidales bacterium]